MRLDETDTDNKQMASEIVHVADRYEIKVDRWAGRVCARLADAYL